MGDLSATFSVDSWDEQPFDEGDGTAKLTRASVTRTYSGDITGTAATEWTMAYAPDGTARFVGVERITGTVGGRDGTLVLQHLGSYADGVARAELTVLTGTGALEGSSGSGELVADPAGSVTLRLVD